MGSSYQKLLRPEASNPKVFDKNGSKFSLQGLNFAFLVLCLLAIIFVGGGPIGVVVDYHHPDRRILSSILGGGAGGAYRGDSRPPPPK